MAAGTFPATVAAQTAKLPPRANGFLTITPLEAKALLEARSEVVIIDVRSLEEFREGALPDSVLVPFFDAMRGKILLPKDTPILLVCAVGGRSMAVGRYLAMQGYQEVYNLKGGLDSWRSSACPARRARRRGSRETLAIPGRACLPSRRRPAAEPRRRVQPRVPACQSGPQDLVRSGSCAGAVLFRSRLRI